MDDCPRSFGTTRLSQLKPDPTLTVATYDSITPAIRLHFDIDMLDNIVFGSGLFARFNNNELLLTNNTWETASRAHFAVAAPAPDIGADIVTYRLPIMEFISIFGWPLPFFTDFPLLVEPVLLVADWRVIGTQIRLTFDSAMSEVPIDGSNFFFRFANQQRAMTFLEWNSPTECRFTTSVIGPNVGADVISFTGFEMPFIATTGAPLADFTDFPVT